MPKENQYLDLSKWFAESLAPFVQQIQAGMAEASRRFEEAVNPLLPKLALAIEGIKRIPDDLRPIVSALAQRGWFVSGIMGFSEMRSLKPAIEAGNSQQIDLLMKVWIENELPDIRARACESFPNRAAIISSAIDAHLSGQYALSVPVLLIQVEGMCLDSFGSKLYSTKDGITPTTKSVTDSLIDSPLAEVFLLPLREPSGLTATKKTRSSYPEAPNRHEILHGHDTEYATLENSLKALSLMDYFVTLVAPRESKNVQVLPGT